MYIEYVDAPGGIYSIFSTPLPVSFEKALILGAFIMEPLSTILLPAFIVTIGGALS